MDERGWLTPNDIPGATKCRALSIPDDPYILAAVSGAINQLCYKSNWQQFGSVTPEQMAQRMATMFEDFMKGCSNMIGTVIAYATVNPPQNTLPCDGQSYERTEYPELYAVLASPFILDAEAFMVPDLRGRVIAGALQFDTAPFNVGNIFGEVDHFLDESEMPTHAHSIDLTLTSLALAPGELPVQTDVIFNTSTGFTGGGAAHNNVQPTVVLNYAIVAR